MSRLVVAVLVGFILFVPCSAFAERIALTDDLLDEISAGKPNPTPFIGFLLIAPLGPLGPYGPGGQLGPGSQLGPIAPAQSGPAKSIGPRWQIGPIGPLGPGGQLGPIK